MQKIKFIFMSLLLAVALTGCYPHRAVGLLQDRDDLPHYEEAPYEPYRIHINDEIVYRLITMDETISKILSQGQNGGGSMEYANSYRVYSDGTIDIPFLDPIPVAGLTLDTAQMVVQDAFRTIIPDAEIKLSIANKTFTVLGDMNSGIFPIYKDKLTIYQALAMTGDLLVTGDHRHVRIIRPRDQQEPEILEFDIRTNTLINSKYYYIYPNDMIYVARSPGSFYKVASYSGFVGLITSSVALLVSVLNYIPASPAN